MFPLESSNPNGGRFIRMPLLPIPSPNLQEWFMGEFSLTHILLVLIICLIFFGPSRLPALGQSLGKAIRGFKEGMDGNEKDTSKSTQPTQPTQTTQQTPAEPPSPPRMLHESTPDPVVNKTTHSSSGSGEQP